MFGLRVVFGLRTVVDGTDVLQLEVMPVNGGLRDSGDCCH
jgi:hypothetical protein